MRGTFFKAVTLIVFILPSSVLLAQKTYKGGYKLVSNERMGWGYSQPSTIVGTAEYRYLDGSEGREYNGNFSFTNDDTYRPYRIYGQFDKGRKTGRWTITYDYGGEELLVKSNFLDGALNGSYFVTIKQKEDNFIQESLSCGFDKNKFSGKISYKADFQKEYSGYDHNMRWCKLNGNFVDGKLDGTLSIEVMSEDDIFYLFERNYSKGILLSERLLDNSTGQLLFNESFDGSFITLYESNTQDFDGFRASLNTYVQQRLISGEYYCNNEIKTLLCDHPLSAINELQSLNNMDLEDLNLISYSSISDDLLNKTYGARYEGWNCREHEVDVLCGFPSSWRQLDHTYFEESKIYVYDFSRRYRDIYETSYYDKSRNPGLYLITEVSDRVIELFNPIEAWDFGQDSIDFKIASFPSLQWSPELASAISSAYAAEAKAQFKKDSVNTYNARVQFVKDSIQSFRVDSTNKYVQRQAFIRDSINTFKIDSTNKYVQRQAFIRDSINTFNEQSRIFIANVSSSSTKYLEKTNPLLVAQKQRITKFKIDEKEYTYYLKEYVPKLEEILSFAPKIDSLINAINTSKYVLEEQRAVFIDPLLERASEIKVMSLYKESIMSVFTAKLEFRNFVKSLENDGSQKQRKVLKKTLQLFEEKEFFKHWSVSDEMSFIVLKTDVQEFEKAVAQIQERDEIIRFLVKNELIIKSKEVSNIEEFYSILHSAGYPLEKD
jgi:hypothetical protein